MSPVPDITSLLHGTCLTPMEPGPMPIIPKALWADVEDWLLSWRHVDALRSEGLDLPGGLLLYGPTGTGKTSLARAILPYMPGREGVIMEAHNTLTQMFGESAANVARGFRAAEACDALLVIEEIDALGMTRRINSQSEENAKITIALMRCLEAAKIPVIGTTNFRDGLDPALLRRFEVQIEVPPLDAKGRAHVLKKILNCEPSPELVAMPLEQSIHIAKRMRRRSFLMKCEEAARQ